MWTLFWDMHSGGGTKEGNYDKIYIEAKEDEAMKIFYNRFEHNPNRVSCTCCGEDYSIDEYETLEEASGYHRHCDRAYFDTKGQEVSEEKGFVKGKGMRRGYTNRYVERQNPRNIEIRESCDTKDDDKWGLYQTLKDYLKNDTVLVIYTKDIKPKEREGEVPEEGYVWMD